MVGVVFFVQKLVIRFTLFLHGFFLARYFSIFVPKINCDKIVCYICDEVRFLNLKY